MSDIIQDFMVKMSLEMRARSPLALLHNLYWHHLFNISRLPMVCANGLSLRECVMCTIRSCCDKLNHTLVTERTGQGGDNPLTFLFRCAIPELIFIIRLCFYLPEMASPLLPALSLSCTLPGLKHPDRHPYLGGKRMARSCQGFGESIK